MDKQITIIIPTFNMEKYLGKCLDSLLIPEIAEVDIIIVNDGSTDISSEIAHSYADRYPNSIRVVDKTNGHYGSCINTGLALAQGRYVRILDSDDWVNSKSFSLLINDLRNLKVDVIFTKNSVYYEAEQRTAYQDFQGMIYGQILDLDSFRIPKDCLKMHCLTYRTKLLREMQYHQTEGICYTDNEYVVGPLLKAKTLWGAEYSLYQYRIGRNEQSVSMQSIVKNVDHYISVLYRLTNYNTTDCNRDNYIRMPIIIRLLHIVFDVFCLFRKSSIDQQTKIGQLVKSLESQYPEQITSFFNHRIKYLPFYKWWYHYNNIFYRLIFPLIKTKI